MKIIVFGCQEIAGDFIKYIATLDDIEIPLIITYELPMDKTYGYKSVLEEAKKLNLNVRNPKRLTNRLIDEIKQISPDIIFSVYYRKIFPKEILSIPKLGCVNIHPSLLPKYRGPVPTAWAIVNGEKTSGVTVHLMDGSVDTGDILVQKEFEIYDSETGYELYTRAMKIGFELLKENFYKILRQEITPRKQVGVGSYYGRLRGRYMINWQQPCENIKNLVRVYSKPYNPSESLFFNKYILINKASIIKDPKYTLQGAGKIVDILEDERLVVSCADGFLVLEEYEIVPKLKESEKEVYFKTGNRLECLD